MGESYPVRPGDVATHRYGARPSCVHIVSEPNFQAGPICATVTGNLSNVEQPAAGPDFGARPQAGVGGQPGSRSTRPCTGRRTEAMARMALRYMGSVVPGGGSR